MPTPHCLTGKLLSDAITSPPDPPPALIEEFLYGHCAFMLSGETGKGKSVLAVQLAISLSSGTPLFSSLHIPKPFRVYYMQMEGSFHEQIHRIHYMSQVIPINTDNLYWDADKHHRLNVMSQASVDYKLKQIASAFPDLAPEVIIIDPIYKVCSDIAKAECATSLVNFSDRIMAEFGSTNILIHHPHREKFNISGKKIEEDDDFYGHSFIKYHIESSYKYKSMDKDGSTGELIRKKAREDNTLQKLSLVYHPETYTCSMIPRPENYVKQDGVLAFIADCASKGQKTDFYAVKFHCDISTQFLRQLQTKLVKEGRIELIKQPGKRTIWIPKSSSNGVGV